MTKTFLRRKSWNFRDRFSKRSSKLICQFPVLLKGLFKLPYIFNHHRISFQCCTDFKHVQCTDAPSESTFSSPLQHSRSGKGAFSIRIGLSCFFIGHGTDVSFPVCHGTVIDVGICRIDVFVYIRQVQFKWESDYGQSVFCIHYRSQISQISKNWYVYNSR